jgi:hypothetical protein
MGIKFTLYKVYREPKKKKEKKTRQIITMVSNRLHEKVKKKKKKNTSFKENFFWLDADERVRHKRKFPHVLHILS